MATLLYSPVACVQEVIGVILLSSGLDGLLESMMTCISTFLYAVASYNLYVHREKFKDILDTLKEIMYIQAKNSNFNKVLFIHLGKMMLIVVFFWISAFLCVIFFISKPFWFSSEERSLVMNSWYPYNKTENPYYQITYIAEVIRLCCMMNMIVGSDCLFMLISFCLIDQYYILSKNFKNIIEQAEKNLRGNNNNILSTNYQKDENYDAVLRKKQNIVKRSSSEEDCNCVIFKTELNNLMKQNVKQHIKLNK